MARKLSFDGTSRTIPTKSLDVGDRLITISPRIEIEDMGTLGLPSYPYKNLPICKIRKDYYAGDRAVERPVVLVKGTIVSLLTDQTVVDDGIVNPAASGDIPVHENAITGAISSQSIDDSPYGYGDSVVSLLVPANGGNASTLSYSSLDDEFGAWTSSSDADLNLDANIPAGIVYNDVYMDIRGANLNYQLDQDVSGVAAKGYISIPFADTSQLDSFGSSANVGDPTNAGYDAVYKKYAFFYFDGSANKAVSGALLKSDHFGRFITESSAADATPSVQTVGKVLATDTRYPRELMDEIRHYPEMKTLPGTKTEGIPTDLYVFVKDVLKADGKDYTASDIRDAIRAGICGYVRISLNV